MNTSEARMVTNGDLFREMPLRVLVNVLLALIVLAWITVFSACETLILILMWMCGYSEQRRCRHVATATGGRWGLGSQILFLLGTHVRYGGLENFREGEHYVVVASHGSLFDIVVMLRTPFMRFVSKMDVFHTPIGWMGRWSGQLFVNNKMRDASMPVIRAGLQKWSDCNVIFFGEGTRTDSDLVRKVKSGAAAIAREFRRPVIPVYIHGAREALPKGPLLGFKSGKTITVTYGKPIPPPQHEKEVDEFCEKIRVAINALR